MTDPEVQALAELLREANASASIEAVMAADAEDVYAFIGDWLHARGVRVAPSPDAPGLRAALMALYDAVGAAPAIRETPRQRAVIAAWREVHAALAASGDAPEPVPATPDLAAALDRFDGEGVIDRLTEYAVNPDDPLHADIHSLIVAYHASRAASEPVPATGNPEGIDALVRDEIRKRGWPVSDAAVREFAAWVARQPKGER